MTHKSSCFVNVAVETTDGLGAIMKKMDLPQELIDYLTSHSFMHVATYGEEPWAAPVYYVIDDDLNLYFISSPETKHCQNIAHNPQVAVTIADSTQKVTDKKIGVQLNGTAEQVSKLESIQWFFKVFNQHMQGIGDILNFDNYRNKLISSRVYKITPQKIRFFNEELYPETDGESEIFSL